MKDVKVDEITFDDDEGARAIEAIKKFESDAKPEPKKTDLISLDDNKGLALRDHSQLMRYLSQLKRGEGFPKQFNTVEQAFAAWTLAASLGLVPQQAWRQIASVKGTLSIFGDLPLALVKKSGLMVENKFKEYLIDAEYNEICKENKNLNAEIFAAFCQVQRHGGTVKEFFFTVEDAKRAGLWEATSSSGGAMPWTLYPKIMIKYKARSVALKSEFPDVLAGISIGEYDHNVTIETRDMVDVTPKGTSLANKLNSTIENIP